MKNLIPALICLFLAIPCQAGVIYVDDDADVGGDGQTWGTAYKYLQDALDDAESGDEIWVAAGTYRPDDDTANHPDGTGLRTDTFQLLNGVALYGGFPPGGGEWEGRDPNAYKTILSGDIGTPDVNTDNSYHVVTGSGTDDTAVLDGFTITAGNADDWMEPHCFGGGMLNINGSPTVMNCTFGGNSAGGGGAMLNRDSSPTLINCTFTGNSAVVESGGGMANSESSPTLTNCTFSGNSAGNAGGMFNFMSNPTLTNCTFSKNSVDYYAGGMENLISNPTLTNCTFSGNSAYYWSGGMYNNYGSPTLTNCTFTGNSSDNYGGGMYNYFYSSPTLTNCILWSNTAPSGPQIYNDGTSSATVRYSDVQGSWPGEGNINTDPCFVEPGYWDPNGTPSDVNDDFWVDGDYHLLVDSLCIDAGDNSVVTVATDLDGKPRIINSTVDMGAYEFRIIYVDANAPGANNGSSWEDAFKHLQDALVVALSGDEIWVAQGIYAPDSNSANPNGSSERTATFQLINGVVIRGGYAGFGEQDPNKRDIELYETILSGDLDGNDVDVNDPCDLLTEPTRNENSSHVVTGNGTNTTAVLDGFTITRGNANGSYGGGMFNCEYSSPTLINCVFSGNSAADGGGMYNGGFDYSNDTGPALTNCMFTGNSAEHVGGGMSNSGDYPTLINCIFMGNSGGGGGGGMSNYISNPILTGCTFIGNSAPKLLIGGGGGGGMGNNRSSPILTNCTFSGNSALFGGGMRNSYESNPTITNCIFWDDTPNEIYIYSVGWPGGTPVITYSDIQGGWPGVGNIDANPLFVDPGRWVDANDPNIVVEPNDPNAVWIDGDYHLKSEGWRWTEELIHDSHWYYDFTTSRCIDAGNPGSPLGDELMSVPDDPCNVWGENIRINMGAYGGTAEASMPPYDWAILADLTNDGTVDFVDFAHAADMFGDQENELPGDFDRDSDVDYTDLFLLTEDWLRETTWHE